MATMKRYEDEMEDETEVENGSSNGMLKTLASKLDEIEDMVEEAMGNEDGGNGMYGNVNAADVGTLGLLGAVGFGGFGGRGAWGTGTVPDGFISYQTNRDVNKGFCETDKFMASEFSFQNLNEANRNADTRELINGTSQSVKDVVGAIGRGIESSILFNERLAGQYFNQLTQNATNAELRAERRADTFDSKLCQIDKEIAIGNALATERNAVLNAKVDAFASRQSTNDVINAQLCKFLSISGCSPSVSPCGQ